MAIRPSIHFFTQRPWEDSRQTGNFIFHRALTFPSGEYSDGRQLRFYPLQHKSGPFLRFGSCKTVQLTFWTNLEAHGVVQTIAGRHHWVPFQSLPEIQQWPDAVRMQPHQNIDFCGLSMVLRINKFVICTIACLYFSQWNLTQRVSDDISLDVKGALSQLNWTENIWGRFVLLIISLPTCYKATVEVLNVVTSLTFPMLAFSINNTKLFHIQNTFVSQKEMTLTLKYYSKKINT